MARVAPGRVILIIFLATTFPLVIALVSAMINTIVTNSAAIPYNESVGGEWMARIESVWSFLARMLTDPYVAAVLFALGLVLSAIERR